MKSHSFPTQALGAGLAMVLAVSAFAQFQGGGGNTGRRTATGGGGGGGSTREYPNNTQVGDATISTTL